MRLKVFLGACLAALFAACEPEAKKEKAVSIDATLLLGQWRNVDMKLHMNTYKDSDSAYTLEVTPGNWEKVMNIRPIRTNFWADSTYNSKHINLRDSVVYNPAGKWYMVGDSLFMIDTFPEKGPVYKYKVWIKGDTARFTGLEDLDGDGKADDNYYGTQRRYHQRD